MTVDPVLFRHGLFNLRTRRFGTAAELLIQKLLNCQAGRTQFHDLYDDKRNHRIEVKFSTVNSSSDEPITAANILKAVESAGLDRAVPFDAWKNHKFDCNIQQIKAAEFDVLYYGLFFSDKIVILRLILQPFHVTNRYFSRRSSIRAMLVRASFISTT